MPVLYRIAQQCLASVRKYKCCLMPSVVNKGVQGVYGALYFLTVSSGGSQTGSEGQGGSANTLFHTGQFSCQILKPSSNPKRRPCRLVLLPFLVKVHELDHKKKFSIIPFICCQLTTRTHCTPCLRWNLTLCCGFPRIVKRGECSMHCKHLCRSLGAPERTTKTAYNYSHAEHTSI